jgi:threonine dehydratase
MDGLEAKLYARQFALEHGLHYVSPYNDVSVIAGQGKIGLELAVFEQLDAASRLVVVLISGVAGEL